LCVGIELLRKDEDVADRGPQLTNDSNGRIETKWVIPGGGVIQVKISGK